jgi:hypothetical protein
MHHSVTHWLERIRPHCPPENCPQTENFVEELDQLSQEAEETARLEEPA